MQKEESAGSTVVALMTKATTSVMLVTVIETPAQQMKRQTSQVKVRIDDQYTCLGRRVFYRLNASDESINGQTYITYEQNYTP